MKKIHFLFLTLVLCTTSLIASSNNSNDDGSEKIKALLTEIASLSETSPHCEVPCGIYGDSLRIALIDEHIRTVEKAMNQINELSKEANPNYNQLVRWVFNKEEHAKEIQHIVSQYFLHQRIKLVDKSDKKKYNKYITQLSGLHEMLVYTMKCKQTTELDNVNKLKLAVEAFEDSYFHKH